MKQYLQKAIRVGKVLADIMMAPKLSARRCRGIEIIIPSERLHCNPAFFFLGEEIRGIARSVNYTLNLHDLVTPMTSARVDTVNSYFQIADGKTPLIHEIDDRQVREHPMGVDGLEDVRAFAHQGKIYLFGSMAVHTEDLNTMTFTEFDPLTGQYGKIQVIESPERRSQEKNWMPFVKGNEIHLIYRFNPVTIFKLGISERGAELTNQITLSEPHRSRGKYSGGSNLVEYKNGFLGLIHKKTQIRNKKIYKHAFVWVSGDLDDFKISKEFIFQHRGVEFASSLMMKDDRFYIGYGVRDRSAWLDIYPGDIADGFFI